MKHITSLLLITLMVCLSACAHQPTVVDQTAPPPAVYSRTPVLLASIQTADAAAHIDDVFFDDDLDFLDYEDEYETEKLVADPIEPFNRAMFVFNDRLYFWALKPAAQAYNAVFPEFVRTGVRNFFHNLKMPARFANCLLQGKGEAAAMELGRFMYNSTFGVLGFGNPARDYAELNPPEEDLGQTLGYYGIGNGFYIVWPVLGPSTLRDSVGNFGQSFANPVRYVEPSSTSLGLRIYDQFNRTSFRIGDYEALKESVFEPYTAMRDLYIQNRQHRIQE